MKTEIPLFFLLCLGMSLFLTHNPKSLADDSCSDSGQGTPTLAGNMFITDDWKTDCECSGAEPTIVSSVSEIDPGGSITLYVDSGGAACPPYAWKAGNGYTISPGITEADLEDVTLSCAAGSCGSDYDVYATITVTDSCGVSYEGVIRNTAGKWVLKSNECGLSGEGEYISGWPASYWSYSYYGLIIGNKRQWQENASARWKSCCSRITCDECYASRGYETVPDCISGQNVGGCAPGTLCPILVNELRYYEWECP